MGFQVTVYSALFVIFCHAVSGSPLGKLRFDDGSYNVQTANLKMEFNLGPKGRKVNQEESLNSINRPVGALRKNFYAGVQDPYKNFIPPRPLVDDGYRPELDPMIGREEDARRVIDSTLYFDTVDHEKMVLNYADRRHDGDLAPMRFHSIRPFFAFSDYHPRGGFFRF